MDSTAVTVGPDSFPENDERRRVRPRKIEREIKRKGESERESERGRKKVREIKVRNERNREGVTDRQINSLTYIQTNKQRNSKKKRDRARETISIQ